MDFLLEFSSEISQLARLLGMRFSPGHPSESSVVGKRIRRLLALEGEGKQYDRDWEFARLTMLTKHLLEIESRRPDILKVFRRAVRRARNQDSFFGIRFEINIAARLIRKSIRFEKGEAPDFSIAHPDGGVFIECTSARIRGAGGLPFLDKVKCTLLKKSAKSYCDNSTALFVDVTNVVASKPEELRMVGSAALKNVANQLSGQSDFGSVLLFAYTPNPQEGRFESNYVRADRGDISPALLRFLDDSFPKGHKRVVTPFMPLEG